MSIIPDPLAVLLNVFPFLIAIMGMYHIILKPMVAYLDERNDAIEGGKNEAASIEEEIAVRTSEYDTQLAEARRRVAAIRTERRTDAQDAYEVEVAKVREETEASIAAAIAEIDTAREAAQAAIKQNVNELADAVAERVLGRELAGN